MPNHQHTLIIDGTSGISGDMTVAALLDLGANEEHLREQLATLPVDGFTIAVTRANKHGIDACDFDVQLAEELENHDHDMAWLYGNEAAVEHMHEHEHHHHHHHHHGHDADEVFVSWGMETHKKFTTEQIEGILKQLENAAEYGMVLRAKGYVASQDSERWIHFDYVPGESDIREGGAMITGRVCVIGSKLNESAIASLFGE